MIQKHPRSSARLLTTSLLAGLIGLTTIGCTNSATTNPTTTAQTPSPITTTNPTSTTANPTSTTATPVTTPIATTPAATPQAAAPTPTIDAMIPAGWKMEGQTSGDLNGDRQPDVALRLIQSGTGDRQRALLVLLAKNGGWEKLAFAPKLLLCQSCGGTLGSPTGENIKIQINDGSLVVEQLRGSRGAVQTTHRFWIDRNSQQLVCIGEDINPYDRANGNKLTDSRNFLTGKRIIEETRGSASQSKAPLRNQQLEVSKVFQSIESIDIEAASSSSPQLPDD
jgi:hypothetical protein